MGLDELATIVATRLDLLRSPVRGTTDRHRTLAALIAWSEELLEPDAAHGVRRARRLRRPGQHGGPHRCAQRRRRVRSRLPAGRPVARRRRHGQRSGPLPAVGDRARSQPPSGSTTPPRWRGATRPGSPRSPRPPTRCCGHPPKPRAGASRADATSCGPRTDGRHHNNPAWLARLTAAVQLHAHTSLWAEPAEWAGRLALVLDPTTPWPRISGRRWPTPPPTPGGSPTAFSSPSAALASDDLRAVAVALEAIADIAMYQGDLARCRDVARRLGDVGRRLDDPHATVLAHASPRSSTPTITTPRCQSSTGLTAHGSLRPIGPGSCTPRVRRWPTLIRCGRWRRSTKRSTWPTTPATGSLVA